MKYPTTLFLLPIFLTCCLRLPAQPGVEIRRDVKKIDIPFEYQNHLMVVNIVFNRIFPLKFIFDTGAEHTILSKREVSDLLRLKHEREFKLLGADMKTELTAYLVRNVHLKVDENMVLPNHSLLVLHDDYFHFDELVGEQIHGILGADVFRGFVVKINYERGVISLMKVSAFEEPPPKDWQSLPLDINRSKPYIQASLQIGRDSAFDVKLLLDTGAMISLLLNTDTHASLRLPPNTLQGSIGAGLGGFIEGYLGRVERLGIGGELELKEVLTDFQELPEGIDTAMLHGRQGILGNAALNRFHIIIDYPRERLYLQPNKRYGKKFEFDKSGLVIAATGAYLNAFVVHAVLANTPAAEAGMLPGDRIRRINFSPAGFLALKDIQRILQGREGKKITVVFERGSRKMKREFRLRKLV